MSPKRNRTQRGARRSTRGRRQPTQSQSTLTLRRHELLGAFPKGGSSDYGFIAMVLPLYPMILTLKNVAPLYAEYRFSYIKIYSASISSQAAGSHFTAFSPTPVPAPQALTHQQVAQFQGFISSPYDKPLSARFPIPASTPWRTTSTTDPALYIIFGQYNTPYNQTCASLYISYTVQFRDPRPNISQTLDPITELFGAVEVPNHE